jgi:hypothetical protein
MKESLNYIMELLRKRSRGYSQNVKYVQQIKPIESLRPLYPLLVVLPASEGELPSLVAGSNIAGFVKVAQAMHDLGDLW